MVATQLCHNLSGKAPYTGWNPAGAKGAAASQKGHVQVLRQKMDSISSLPVGGQVPRRRVSLGQHIRIPAARIAAALPVATRLLQRPRVRPRLTQELIWPHTRCVV